MASAINEFTFKGRLDLKYLSMSYYHWITDAGVKILTYVFPPTLTELGIVDCNIGEEGGFLCWAMHKMQKTSEWFVWMEINFRQK